MRRRFLNLTLALGLVTGLLVGAIGTASAETPVDSEQEWLFFPWVPNGEFLNGDVANVNGPWYGTITIQNLEDFRIWVDFGQTAGGVKFGNRTTLEAHASKTFSAAQLGIAAPGAAVAVRSGWYYDGNAGVYPGFCDYDERYTTLVTRGATPGGSDVINSQRIAYVHSVTSPDGNVDYDEGSDYFFDASTNSINWSPNGAEPQPGTNAYRVNYYIIDCERGPEIGGVQKQVMATASASGQTNASHLSVDGYTAIPDEDVAWGPASVFCHDVNQDDCNALGGSLLGIPIFGSFDGHSYIPIVQNRWNGWNSTLHISNIDASSPAFAAVTVTLYPAGGQGVSGPSIVAPPILVAQGATETIDIAELVGTTVGVWSVWITSDYGVVANASRYKAQTRMLLTNQSAPSLLATTSVNWGNDRIGAEQVGLQFEMHAPLIFKDYNGWNTGINIANISEFTNTVTVTFYGPTGNVVGSDSRSIPPKAMEYIYMPAQQDLGLNVGFVGAATLSSLLPFHAAVDEVKYTTAANTGQDQGQAMSYIATAAGASCDRYENYKCYEKHDDKWDTFAPYGSTPRLSIPLLQKGNTLTGLGDTSGINLFNADANSSVTAWVQFYHPSGALAAPTVAFPFLEITLGPLNTATLYTHNYSEMSQGFQGSAQVIPVQGAGNLFGVSNNVNYEVQYDGSAVYNLLNTWGQYRLFCSQTNTAACIYQGGIPGIVIGGEE